MKLFRSKILISFGLLFIASGCASPPPPIPSPDYTLLSQGQQSGFTLQKTFIIENTDEFNELWAIHSGGKKKPAPIINFDNAVVIASFLGEKPTGGYSIKVNKVVYSEKYTQVIISIHRPPPGSMRTMQITQPYIMIKLNRTKNPIYIKYNRES